MLFLDVFFILNKQFTMNSLNINNDFLSSQKKKNIKLIPIDPIVYFTTLTNSNQSVFLPVLDISRQKYLPFYLKQYNPVKFCFFLYYL